MILRLFCVLLLISLGTATAWYIFRDTPQKQLQRWRETSEALFREQGDLEKAEELNRKILELVPHSAYDLVFSAHIKERKGTTAALNEALAIYEKLIARGDPRLDGVCLYKSRVLRTLGRYREAQAMAGSVLDALPFDANMELGDTALASRRPREAALYFTQAIRHASRPIEEVRAREGQAAAYWLAISRARENPPEEQTELAVAARTYREILERAHDLLIGIDEDPTTRDRIRLRLADLAEKRARLSEAGETPYWSTAQILRERVERDESLSVEVSSLVYAQLGNLYLQALHREIDAVDDQSAREIKERTLREAAESCFLRSLGNRSPEAGRALVLSNEAADEGADDDPAASPSALAEGRREYVLNLLGIAQLYLATTEFEKVLRDDTGGLSLATRITDAAASPDAEVAGTFSVIRAFAHLKSSDQGKAEELLDGYVANLPDETRAWALVELARQCFRTQPESPLAFKYLDLFKTTGAGPLDLASQRLRLLDEIGAASPALAREASARFEKTIATVEESSRTVEERIYLAELLVGTKGFDAAVKSLLESPENLRSDPALHEAIAALLTERGVELTRDGDTGEATVVYRAALTQYLKLFLRDPTRSYDVTRRAAFILRLLESESPDFSLEPLLRGAFPDVATADRERFGAALKHLLLGELEEAVRFDGAIEEIGAFQPIWSYMAGTCHLEIANGLRQARSAEDAVEAEIARALEAFRRHPEYLPSKAELIDLELRNLDAEADVPDELLTRIDTLGTEGRAFEASWLLSKALERRFRHRYRDRELKNSAVARVLQRRQSALREAIRHRPRFTAAYLALADSFLVSDRLDHELQVQGSPLERKLYRADHERALLLLESVPEPDTRVLAMAAACSTAAGRPADARTYLETLCATEPTIESFTALLTNYLGSGTNHDVEVVLGDRDAIDLTTGAIEWRDHLRKVAEEAPRLAGLHLRSVLNEIRGIERAPNRAILREALLSVLHGTFVEVPGHQGLAYTSLGQLYAVRSARSRLEEDRRTYREKAIAAYEEAVLAHERRGSAVPLHVLNNLAWILVDAPDASPAELDRGLEVAERARDALEGVLQLPDVIDTYAWALYRSRRLIEAEAELTKLLEQVESPTYRYHLACVLAELKRFGDAHIEARRALDASTSFPEEDAARELMRRMRQARIEALGKTAMASE